MWPSRYWELPPLPLDDLRDDKTSGCASGARHRLSNELLNARERIGSWPQEQLAAEHIEGFRSRSR
ncbi:MAG: hypothetical protein R3C56_23520 [Pirellulaceae bacterium]